MKIDIQTTASQQMTCDEIEKFVKAHIGGVRTSLDEPVGGYDAPFPIDEGYSLPTSIQMSDGIYLDTKQKLQAKDINVTGTEYVRILDDAVREILLANVTHAAEGKISKAEALAVTIIGESWFKGNTSIKNLECLKEFENVLYSDGGWDRFTNTFQNCTSLEAIRLPKKLMRCTGSNGYAFGNCSSLKLIELNPGLKLGSETFRGANNIEKIIIPSVADYLSVYEGGYYGKNSLPSVGGKASLYLTTDESTPLGTSTNPLTIPKTITQINSYALYNLQSVTNLHYAGTSEEWANVTLGTSPFYNLGTSVIHCDGDNVDVAISTT